MRVLSLTLRAAATAQETDQTPAVLVTVTHPELPEPLRLSSDPSRRLSADPPLYGTTSRGQTFWHIPMSVILPDSQPQAAPRAQLQLDNIAVDRDLAGIPGLARARVSDLLRLSPRMATVLLELVLSTTPDVVERRWPLLETVAATVEGPSVVLDFGRDNRAREPFPALTFSSFYFPGLF